MTEKERMLICDAIRYVDCVVLSVDDDRSICKTLAAMQPRPHYFINGGDQNNKSIPETDVCNANKIIMLDGFGDKIQSSSWLTGIKAKKQVQFDVKPDQNIQ